MILYSIFSVANKQTNKTHTFDSGGFFTFLVALADGVPGQSAIELSDHFHFSLHMKRKNSFYLNAK